MRFVKCIFRKQQRYLKVSYSKNSERLNRRITILGYSSKWNASLRQIANCFDFKRSRVSIVYHHLWNKKLFLQHLLVFVVFAAKWFNIKIYPSQSRVLDIKQALTMSNKNNNHFFVSAQQVVVLTKSSSDILNWL